MIDKTTYKLLRKLYSRNQMTYDEIRKLFKVDDQNIRPAQVSALYENHLAVHSEDGNGSYCKITLLGRAYIENKNQNSRNFWVPYLITTLLALASLFVSFLGVLPE